MSNAASLEDLREWPHETVVRLFSLVKPHRVLYDNTHEQWMNKTHKGRLWTTIAKELDPYLTSRRCRDRFVMMRRRVAADIRRQLLQNDPNIEPDTLWLLGSTDDEKENGINNNSTSAPTQVPLISHRDSSESSIDAETGFVITDNSVRNSEPSVLDSLIEQIKDRVSSPPTTSLAELLEEDNGQVSVRPAKRQRRKSTAPQKISTPEAMKVSTLCPDDFPVEMDNFLLSANMNIFDVFNTLRSSTEQKQIDEECRMTGRQIELDLRKLSTTSRLKVRLEINQLIARFLYQDSHVDANEFKN